MQKQQKNLHLPAQVVAWLHDEEERTGVPLSRLAVAALAALASFRRTDRSEFIRLAVQIEKGELKPEEVCRVWKEASIKACQLNQKLLKNQPAQVARWKLEEQDHRRDLEEIKRGDW